MKTQFENYTMCNKICKKADNNISRLRILQNTLYITNIIPRANYTKRRSEQRFYKLYEDSIMRKKNKLYNSTEHFQNWTDKITEWKRMRKEKRNSPPLKKLLYFLNTFIISRKHWKIWNLRFWHFYNLNLLNNCNQYWNLDQSF